MTEKKRQTQIEKLPYFEQLLEIVTDPQQKDYLESFKQKLDFARYYLDSYEDGVRKYNTPLSQHDIALIVKANAEAFLFIIRSSLDCLANFLNERFMLAMDKVYFNYELQRQLAQDRGDEEKELKCTISRLILTFLNDNDYFFRLRNLVTHNTVVKADYALNLSEGIISAFFQEIDDAANALADRKVDS